VAGATFTAPATVTITAAAADSDGTVSKVEYYNGATLLGTSTVAPYSFSWTNVGAGTYSVTAKATDNKGASTTSAAVSVTVGAAPVAASKLYFVHPDHLGSPRLIADQSQKTIWRWENEEVFGLAGHQEDPDSDGTRFTFNLRFEGQYHDQESGLRHNRFRDYDPSTGRYVQADPIGLDGGISLYGYVSGNPLSFVDPLGLAKCTNASPDFDTARRDSFDKAGMTNPDEVEFSKVDPATGTVVEFKGAGGAKVGYDGPHASPGKHHDVQHISWQTAGKRSSGGTQRGNEPYSGQRHPSRPDRKEQGF
jgi:RHS repeat-associated protein